MYDCFLNHQGQIDDFIRTLKIYYLSFYYSRIPEILWNDEDKFKATGRLRIIIFQRPTAAGVMQVCCLHCTVCLMVSLKIEHKCPVSFIQLFQNRKQNKTLFTFKSYSANSQIVYVYVSQYMTKKWQIPKICFVFVFLCTILPW